MTIANELFEIADRLKSQSRILNENDFNKPLQQLKEVAQRVGSAWSGSWLGYHSRVYYADFIEPPPGAHFSQDWGLMDSYGIDATIGDWKEYRFDDVVSFIKREAGNPDTHKHEEKAQITKEIFEESQSQLLSLFSRILDTLRDDRFFNDIVKKVEDMKVFGINDFINTIRPSQMISRDMTALQAGLHTPAHIFVLAQTYAIRKPFIACGELSKLTRRAASHIQHFKDSRETYWDKSLYWTWSICCMERLEKFHSGPYAFILG